MNSPQQHIEECRVLKIISVIVQYCRRGNYLFCVVACAQLLACVHDEEVTYVATSNVQDLVPPDDVGDDPSPLLTPEPLYNHQEEETTNHHSNPISVIVHQVTALLIMLLLFH